MRLAPDMFPFIKQVQLTCDFAKNTVGRLTGEPPKFPDEEKTLRRPEGAHRQDASTTCKSFKPAQIDATEDKDVTFPIGPQQTMTLKGAQYLHRLRAAELLFPRHHRLRHPAPLRRRDRQARFPRAHVSG